MFRKGIPATLLALGTVGALPASATIESFSCEPLEFTMGAFNYKFYDCVGGESDGESNGTVDHVIKERKNKEDNERPLDVLYNSNDKGTEETCKLFEKPFHPVRAMTLQQEETYQKIYELLLQMKAEQELQ